MAGAVVGPQQPGTEVRNYRPFLHRFDAAGRTIAAYDGIDRPFRDIDRILPDPAGRAAWLATHGGLLRLVLAGAEDQDEAGALSILPFPDHSFPRVPPPPSRVALAGRFVVRSRGDSVSFTELRATGPPAVAAVPFGLPVWDVAPAGAERVWVALRFGGLRLCGPQEGEACRDSVRGLPSLDVHALAAVPGSGGRTVWAATAGGAARVRIEGERPVVERTARVDDGLPSGPVDALAALPDGSAFLAYNALDRAFLLDPRLAMRRAATHVRFLPARGGPGHRIDFPGTVQIRALAASPDGATLWAGTREGLFVARRALRAGSRFAEVGAVRRPVAILAVDRRGTVWAGVESRRWSWPPFVPPDLIGYRPGTRNVRTVTGGLPASGAVDDLDFTDGGELVVLVGSRLARGRIAVPPVSFSGRISTWLLIAILLILYLNHFLGRYRRSRLPQSR